jgi:hypothetical protein
MRIRRETYADTEEKKTGKANGGGDTAFLSLRR